jgi:hypothetical protein
LPVSRATGITVVDTTPDAVFVHAGSGDYQFTAQ